MELDDIRRLITTRMHDNWNLNDGPVVYPNQSADNYAGTLHYDLQIVFPPSGRERMSIGGFKDVRQTGYAFLLGFAPKDSGTSQVYTGLSKFKDIFEECRITENNRTLVFKVANFNTLGLKNQMYRVNAQVEFYTDSVN